MALPLDEYETRILALGAAGDADGILDYLAANFASLPESTPEMDFRLAPPMNLAYSIGDPRKVELLQDLLNGRVPAGPAT